MAQFSEQELATRAEREAIYGKPEINLGGIGTMWAAMINQHYNAAVIVAPLPASLVSLMMVAVKLNRCVRTPTHEDTHHDAHVYLKLAEDLAHREAANDATPPPHEDSDVRSGERDGGLRSQETGGPG